jgi:hypothetical protein
MREFGPEARPMVNGFSSNAAMELQCNASAQANLKALTATNTNRVRFQISMSKRFD